MTTQGKMVMWIGLFLITMNVVVNWQTIKGALFAGESGGSGSGGSGGSGFGLGGVACSGCSSLPSLPLRLACEAACGQITTLGKTTPPKAKAKAV